jgi:peptidoglycan-N-acetylglucosamine deacetylase
LIVFALVFAGSALAAPGLMTVTVDGKPQRVDESATLGQVLQKFHLHPKPGSLLDVDGIVVRAANSRGAILVNGHPYAPGEQLKAGDIVEVINGKDRTEDLVRTKRTIVGRMTANPQTRLANIPGVEIITSGSYSKKVVGVQFQASPGAPKPMKAVALTFDDGPSLATRHILATLKKYKVPATFFIVGTQAQRYPKLVVQEAKEGHVLANHSWSHPQRPVFARLSGPVMTKELIDAQRVIDAHGPKPKLFRPPGGSLSAEVVGAAKRHGMRTVLWSVDPKDWQRGRGSASIVSDVLSRVGPGSIVLLHDGGNNAWSTAAALPAIIEGIRAKGLKLVALTR